MAGDLPDGPLVDAAWVRQHRDEVRIVDVRWYLDGRSGHEAYLSGHIPGAVWADIDRQLSAPAGPIVGRHPLPPAADFAAAMGRLGIGDDDVVVAYDDASGSIAARLWWMLDSLGMRAYVLDGGISTWIGALDRDGPVQPDGRSSRRGEWPAGRSWMPTRSMRFAAAVPCSMHARSRASRVTSRRWTPLPVTSRARAARPGPRTSTPRPAVSCPPTCCGGASRRSVWSTGAGPSRCADRA